MKRLIPFIFFLIPQATSAQGVSAYSDNRRYFYAFDKGVYQQLEYLAVMSYRVSGNSIAYVDNTNEFKVYYGGHVYKQDIYAADFQYFATGNIVPFRLGRALYVFDQGQRTALTYYSTTFAAGDSILAFFDETSPGLRVYDNGQVVLVEDALLTELMPVTAGSNLVAYVDQSEYFKVYYHSTTTTLSQSPPISVRAGADIVAYVDGYTNGFFAFYRGDTARLDDFAPVSYKTGYGILAYVNSLQEFLVLADGGLRKLSSCAPTSYNVVVNILTYVLNNRFMVYYNGREIELENYVPSEYKISNNGIAWLDVNRRLMFFWKGQVYTASMDVITDFTLDGDVLSFQTGPNHVRFYYNGREY